VPHPCASRKAAGSSLCFSLSSRAQPRDLLFGWVLALRFFGCVAPVFRPAGSRGAPRAVPACGVLRCGCVAPSLVRSLPSH
jgi:hypothetical protein